MLKSHSFFISFILILFFSITIFFFDSFLIRGIFVGLIIFFAGFFFLKKVVFSFSAIATVFFVVLIFQVKNSDFVTHQLEKQLKQNPQAQQLLNQMLPENFFKKDDKNKK